jgi:light-regulated signal transduction histidine kinase (bacteriophytochrome)
MAQDIAAELQQQQPDRKVDWVIAAGLAADADPGLMHIALDNLLRNAWKFTAKTQRARIEFGAAEHDGQRAYFVRDNGAGFDERYASRLFQPFQRLHGVSEFEGTGIGLAIVDRIVRRHGGRIWAQAAVGAGASFYFTLTGDGTLQ